jgi:hypothetical protein
MNEINKDEILDLKKWQRFFFMVIYSFAINAVVNILIILAVLQSFFYLFTSRTNAQVQSANNWLQVFFNDALNFLSFNTNAKPWPFSNKPEASESEEEVDIVEGASEEVSLDDEQPEQTKS